MTNLTQIQNKSITCDIQGELITIANLLDSAQHLPCFHEKTTQGCDQADTLIRICLERTQALQAKMEGETRTADITKARLH